MDNEATATTQSTMTRSPASPDAKRSPHAQRCALSGSAIVLIGGYIALQMMSDIAATKVILLGPLVMDAGFIYSLTFTWRDLIHKRLGIQAARTSILLAGIINVFMALYFQFVVWLEPESSWAAAGGQAAWAFVFGLVPRVVTASIIAEVLAELTDTEVYRLWMERRTRRLPQWTRVLVSNAVSIPLDSLLFVTVAFADVLSAEALAAMFLSNIVTKGAFSLVSLWLIYLVPSRKHTAPVL